MPDLLWPSEPAVAMQCCVTTCEPSTVLQLLALAFSCSASILVCSSLAHVAATKLCAGMDVVLHAMAAAEWEVRNSASLAFAALLHRMLGFSNPVKVRSAC